MKEKIKLEVGICSTCARFGSWQEYGVWFADCNFEWPDDEEPEEEGGAKACPYWKGIEIYNCPIHGEYTDGCNKCEYLWQLICNVGDNLFKKGLKMTKVIEDIVKERDRQISLAHGGDTEEFDKGNSKNDWIAYVNAYIGRAANKVFRNEKENQDFRENMVKAAALCIAALEAHDKGYC